MIKTVVFGSGFISSHLVTRLQSLGHTVTLIHHNQPYTIKEADYIFYLSSYGNHYHQKDKAKTIQANILDLYALLKHTKNIKYKALINFSTSSVILPVQTLYSDTKFVGEILCKRYAHKYKKPIVNIRPYSLYGEGDVAHHFIPTIIRCLKEKEVMKISDGWHDWICVSDFIDGVVAVMENIEKVQGKSISIGTGKQYSNMQVIEALIHISGLPLETKYDVSAKRHYDTKSWIADTTMMKALGWKPNHSLVEGLQKTWEAENE